MPQAHFNGVKHTCRSSCTSYPWSNGNLGSSTAQAVSRWLIVAARVRAQARSWGIWGEQNGTEKGFFPVLRFHVSITPLTVPHSSSTTIRGWCKRPNNGRFHSEMNWHVYKTINLNYKLGYFSRFRNRLRAGLPESTPGKEQKIFLYSTVFRQALVPVQTPVKCVPASVS
jgi:hypothetical protein